MYHCINYLPLNVPIIKHPFKKLIASKLQKNAYRFELFALKLKEWADKIDENL